MPVFTASVQFSFVVGSFRDGVYYTFSIRRHVINPLHLGCLFLVYDRGLEL